MKIYLRTDGGFAYFPGRNRTISIDLDKLPPEELATFKSLMALAKKNHKNDKSTRHLPDGRIYTISIQEGSETHSIRLPEPIQEPSSGQLIDFIREHGNTDAS